MSTIRCIYHPVNDVAQQPKFPATDQHPDAVRYLIGLYYVDALGGQPTQAEIDAVLNPASVPNNGAALDQARLDATRKQLDSQIASLSQDQQAIFLNMMKLFDKET